jgi:hypothetical protein
MLLGFTYEGRFFAVANQSSPMLRKRNPESPSSATSLPKCQKCEDNYDEEHRYRKEPKTLYTTDAVAGRGFAKAHSDSCVLTYIGFRNSVLNIKIP